MAFKQTTCCTSTAVLCRERRAREQSAVGRMERKQKGKEEAEIKKREVGERGGGEGKNR